MESKKKSISVIVIGSMPPPIGGVTVHIQRLFQRASEDRRVDIKVLDIKKLKFYDSSRETTNLWRFISALYHSNVLHIQISSQMKLILALMGFLLGKKIVYTHHNARPLGALSAYVLGFCCKKIVLVNNEVRSFYRWLKKVVVVPAFIAPVSPEELRQDVLKSAENYDILLAVNAYRKSYISGAEVYGIDILYQAVTALSTDISEGRRQPYLGNVGVFFFDPSDTHDDLNIGSHSAITVERYAGDELSFYELLKISHICLRPTRTDGDPLSIREALHLGVKVIASDVTDRPDGVHLFTNNSYSSLMEELDTLIRRSIKNKMNNIKAESTPVDFYDQLVSVYESTLT